MGQSYAQAVKEGLIMDKIRNKIFAHIFIRTVLPRSSRMVYTRRRLRLFRIKYDQIWCRLSRFFLPGETFFRLVRADEQEEV